MKKRIIKGVSTLLLIGFIFQCVPLGAMAAAHGETKPITEVDIDESYIDEGMFYLTASELEVEEKDTDGYLLKIARNGNSGDEVIRLTMTDITAKYGVDYTAELYDRSLFSNSVENTKESTSMLEILANNDKESYNYSDAIIEGLITKDDQLEEGVQSNDVINDDTFDEISQVTIDALNHEEDEETNKESQKSELGNAREDATGLKNDKVPMSVTPVEQNEGLGDDSLGYMKDGIKEVSDELNSAYLDVEFDDGENEKYVEIHVYDNEVSDGDKKALFDISGPEGAYISGVYSSFTLTIKDDEKYIPDKISFSDSEYSSKDGYITVKVVRTGNLREISTVMIDSFDDSAIEGRDYSKVHAKVIFSYGITENEIKIPIKSNFIEDKAVFTLKIQEPQGCAVDETNSTATCIIRAGDKSFEVSESDYRALASSSTGTLGVATNINLNSVVDGPEFCLKDMVTGSEMTNAECKSEPLDENGWKLYAHKHGNDVKSAVGFSLGQTHYDYSAYKIYWSRKAGRPTWGRTVFENFDGGIHVQKLYNKDTERWDHDIDTYYLNTAASSGFDLGLYAETGLFATNPTLEVYYIKPILRPFKIDLIGADPFYLINENGERVKNTEITSYMYDNDVMMENSSENSLVTVSGNSVSIKLSNYIHPVSYISGLYIVNTTTGEKRLVRENLPEGTLQVSLPITNSLISNNLSCVEFPKNGSHGFYGHFALQPIVSPMPATVRVTKNDKADITVWDGKLVPCEKGSEYDVYKCSVGDVLRYNVTLKDGYSATYRCEEVEISTDIPLGVQPIRILTSGRGYAQAAVKGTLITISPITQQNDNKLIVRLPAVIKNMFDTTTGVFDTKVTLNGQYYDYIVDDDSAHIAGKEYELVANMRADGYIPEWTLASNRNVSYSQNTFYYTGSTQTDENVLYLSAAKASNLQYKLNGKIYYDDVALGGQVSAEAWYPAEGAYCIVDNAHYGIADNNGLFSTTKFPGVNGDYVKYKIVAGGSQTYGSIRLNQNNQKSVTYEGYKETFYEVDLANRIVAASSNTRPHISSVKVTTFKGVSTGAVFINDDISILYATVSTIDPATGEPYKYTYVDEKGNTITKTEKPIGVEFIVYDPVTHEKKSVFNQATTSDDGINWRYSYSFKSGHYAEYRAGDIIYARLITDRIVGNGGTEDEQGNWTKVDAMCETYYAPVRTSYYFVDPNPKEPEFVDVPLGVDDYFTLPIIGNLTTMTTCLGLSLGVSETETGGIRLYFGKQIKSLTKGNCFDGNGNAVSDTGFKIGGSNFTEGFSDMKDIINTMGSKNLAGRMAVGIPVWSIQPIVGLYLEFAMYHNWEEGYAQDRLEFCGGGGYIGAIGSFRYTYYFIVFGAPVYVGGDVSITLLAEMGIAPDENAHIAFTGEKSQDFIDDILDKTHFQFIFRALVVGNAYAGIGICGTAGFRGGFTLTLKFIINPMVKKTYPDVRSTGFAVTGTLKFWADVVLFTIPIPTLSWDFYKMGYFQDIADKQQPWIYAPNPNTPIMKKPRNTEEAKFVGNKPVLKSTFEPISSKDIVKNSYDDPQQQLLPFGEGKSFMVYLDDDKTRDDDNRTVLKYSIYENEKWSVPVVIQDDNTADFSPNLCDAGDDIIISWASRPATDLNEYSDYLDKMEIYTVRFNKASRTLGTIEQLTNDDYFDTNPQAIYDRTSGDILVLYSKSDVGEINDSSALLNAALPTMNNSEIMYMLYDGNSGEWVRNKFFDNEVRLGADVENLLNTFKGQRFLNTSIEDFEITNPVISDFSATNGRITNLDANDLNAFNEKYAKEHGFTDFEALESGEKPDESVVQEYYKALEEFKAKYTKNYGVYAFTVDEDNNLTTENDREVFVQIYDFTDHKTYKPIRITDNDVNDCQPQLVYTNDEVYLFWLHDGNTVQYVTSTDMICEKDENNCPYVNTVTAKCDNKEVPQIKNFIACADYDDNLYIAWQMSSGELSEDSSELNPTEDIYLSGYIKSDSGSETYSRWSDAIRITDNGKMNNLPSFADLGNGSVMMVNTQYNIDMNSNVYEVSDTNLVETIYSLISSLKVDKINVEPTMGDSDKLNFAVDIVLKNDGVRSEDSFEYSSNLMYKDELLGHSSGEVVESVPAGGYTTIREYYQLDMRLLDHLEELEMEFNVYEDGTNKPIMNRTPIISGGPKYELVGIDAVQNEDDVIISGYVKNIGSKASDGTDKLYIYHNGELENEITAVELPKLGIGHTYGFQVKIKPDSSKASSGYLDYALVVKSATGESKSEWETDKMALSYTFDLAINGNKDIEKIELKKGDKIPLKGSYGADDFFRNGSTLFSVDDTQVAGIGADGLVALEAGETVLRMTVAPYGGCKSVKLVVSDNSTHVSGISFEKDSYSMEVGKDITINPVIAPANATDKSVMWFSDNEAVAKVSNDGKVIGLKAGKAIITAMTNEGKFIASTEITVTEKENKPADEEDDPSTPPTGDDYNPIPWIAMICVSSLAILGIAYRRKKHLKK